jgi:hypothetical protein
MITKIIKWSAIGALIVGEFFRPVAFYGITRLVVLAAAVIVLTQAANMRRYVWMGLFFVVALMINPIFPIPYSTYFSIAITTSAVLLFFFSVNLLQPAPRLSIPSITGGMPGGEAL